ncbi:MAG: redoxin domain-containing protein [Candidatus Aminicenantes bacterium]|nr:redoxin domain-containing protein [Candidatus Aminicenantes bacterium]
MRKKNICSVYIIVLAVLCLSGMLLSKERSIKIFNSLKEAVPEPEVPVMLVFFSIDCHVCWEDLFEMKFFVEKNRLPVIVVGITKDPEKDVVSFLMKYSFSSPVVCDRKKELFRKFKVSLEPFIIIVLNGEILYKDDYYLEFAERKEKIKKWLLEMNLM